MSMEGREIAHWLGIKKSIFIYLYVAEIKPLIDSVQPWPLAVEKTTISNVFQTAFFFRLVRKKKFFYARWTIYVTMGEHEI